MASSAPAAATVVVAAAVTLPAFTAAAAVTLAAFTAAVTVAAATIFTVFTPVECFQTFSCRLFVETSAGRLVNCFLLTAEPSVFAD